MAFEFQPSSSCGPAPRPVIKPAVKDKGKDKDFSEIEKLYRMYGKYAFSLAKQIIPDDQLAEEIVQDAFLIYWKDASIQKMNSVAFFGWLMKTVKETCWDWLIINKPTQNQMV